jgi:hypothetical protein
MSGANGHDDWPAAEASVLGALLLGAPFAEVARILDPEHFTRHEAKLIFRAIATLAAADTAADVTTVTAQLTQTDHLQAAGGQAALSALARETPTPANVAAYARAVRDQADCARLRQVVQANDGAELLAAAQGVLAARATLSVPPAPNIVLRHIADIVAERREPQWLAGLHEVLERDVLAMLAGSRSTFKSFIAQHWAMLAAVSGEPVVILSAEGAGLDRRTDAWMRTYAPAVDLRNLKLYALERALNLNAPATLAALREAIDAAGCTPALGMIDTFSKFAPGLDENDNAAVALYLATVSEWLRAHYRCTWLFVAHSGHADAARPRGAYTLMANPDAEYIVKRPDLAAMEVTVSRERFKDSPSLPPLAYHAEVVDLSRLDSYGKPVTSLILRDTDLPPMRPMLSGKNQKALLAEIERRAAAPDCVGIWTEGELREIGRGLGMGKQSARDAVLGLRNLGYFTASVGGCRLAHLPEQGQKGQKRAERQDSARAVGAEKAEGSIDPCLSALPSAPPSAADPAQLSADVGAANTCQRCGGEGCKWCEQQP